MLLNTMLAPAKPSCPSLLAAWQSVSALGPSSLQAAIDCSHGCAQGLAAWPGDTVPLPRESDTSFGRQGGPLGSRALARLCGSSAPSVPTCDAMKAGRLCLSGIPTSGRQVTQGPQVGYGVEFADDHVVVTCSILRNHEFLM